MPAGNWNEATDKQLLMSVIHLTAPNPPKWDQVAAMMGEGFTAESTRQHYAKLKKACAKEFGEAPAAAAATKTPTKRGGKKAAGEGGTKSAGSKRKDKTVDAGTSSGQDDEDEDQSPTKKLKEEATEEGNDEEV